MNQNPDSQTGISMERSDATGLTRQLLEYYGLRQDPFDADANLIFLTPSLTKLLKLLGYLAGFSEKILVLSGPPGIGKTTFAGHFYDQIPAGREACWITALDDDTPVQILREILDQSALQLAEDADAEAALARLGAHLEMLAKEGAALTLVVDDAQLLGKPLLEMLLELVGGQDDRSAALHLVLVGEPELEPHLHDLLPPARAEQSLFQAKLEPFSLKECKQYLHARFQEAGVSEPPFTENDYLRLYQLSAGIPARINAAAYALLDEGVTRLLQPQRPANPWLWTGLAGGVLAVVLVFGYLMLGAPWWPEQAPAPLIAPAPSMSNGTVQRDPITTERASPDLASSAPAPEINSTEDAAELDGMNDEDVGQDLESETLVAEQPAEEIPLPEEDGSVAIAAAESGLAEDVEAENTLEESIPEESILAESAEPQSAVADQTESEPDDLETTAFARTAEPAREERDRVEETSPSARIYTEHEQALLAIAADRYIMQILGARTERQVQNFLAALPAQEGFYYFASELNGQPWYVLVYGDFASYQDAVAAVEQLPEQVRRQQPWIRKAAGVQQAISTRN